MRNLAGIKVGLIALLHLAEQNCWHLLACVVRIESAMRCFILFEQLAEIGCAVLSPAVISDFNQCCLWSFE